MPWLFNEIDGSVHYVRKDDVVMYGSIYFEVSPDHAWSETRREIINTEMWKLNNELNELNDILNEKAHTDEVILRPDVRWFAEQMELKLRKNDYKGGWEGIKEEFLEYRILEEYVELKKASSSVDKIDECVDIANFAMMDASNQKRLYEKGNKHTEE